PYAEGPRRGLFAGHDGVDQGAEPRTGDPHDVAVLVGEARAGRLAVLGRCEQRAGEQHEAVRVLVVRTVGGRHQVQYVAADLPQGAAAPQDVAVRALDAQVDVEPADGVETEAVVEQADERADGARGVVVLGAGQQQGAASLDV